MAARARAGLIDLGAFATAEDGLSWRAPWMQIGDGVHYTPPVRDWITEQMVSYMAARIPSRTATSPDRQARRGGGRPRPRRGS